MTTRYERRIRHLEARNMMTGANAVVLGLPGPQPTADEISRASLVLQIAFVSTKDGRLVEGGSHAQH